MSDLGKLTDKLEHKLNKLVEQLEPELKPVWRKLRGMRDEALNDLVQAIKAELKRRVQERSGQ